MSDQATTQPRRRTPSVAELQAALRAAHPDTFPASAVPVAAETSLPAPARGSARSARLLPAGLQRPGPRRGARLPATVAPGSRQLAVTLLGSHGGSGATCLSVLLPGAELADRAWSCEGDRPVVLVCRSTHRGLTSAQDNAREHRDADCGPAALLGVVIIADAPGRTPSSLVRLERLLAGAVPVLGHVPWMEAWRIGSPTTSTKPPSWLRTLTAAIAAADLTAASTTPSPPSLAGGRR